MMSRFSHVIRQYSRALALAVAVITCANCADLAMSEPKTTTSAKDTPVTRVDLEEVIGVIKDALKDTRAEILAANLPPLKSVTISLKTETAVTSEGTIKVFVSGAKSRTKTNSEELTLELAPPKTSEKAISSKHVYKALREALLGAADAAKRSARAAAPELGLKTVTTEIAFEVEASKEIGGELKFSVVELSAKVQKDTTGAHTITVEFGLE